MRCGCLCVGVPVSESEVWTLMSLPLRHWSGVLTLLS